MSIRSLLEQYAQDLTEADRQLVRVLFNRPTEAAFMSATRLAEQAGVHPAAAVRLAKKLGFRGYLDMREAFRAEILQHSDSATRIERRLARAGFHDILQDLVESEIASLRELPSHVTQAQIDEVTKTLMEAGRVFLFAQGHAIALAELMDRRLRRAGLNIVVLRSQGRDLVERLLTLNNRDVVLAFALHVRPRGLNLVLEEAAKVKASSILITDAVDQLPKPKPTFLLAAPRGDAGEYQTLTIPMAVCNSLVLNLARLDKSRSLRALNKLDRLTDRIEQDDIHMKHDSHP